MTYYENKDHLGKMVQNQCPVVSILVSACMGTDTEQIPLSTITMNMYTYYTVEQGTQYYNYATNKQSQVAPLL